jgi:hypothetical protein
MATKTYPLGMPDDLLQDMAELARKTNLSIADAMRQSMKLGAPKLLDQLSADQTRPFTDEETKLAYETPNPEFDELEHHCALMPKRRPAE